MAILSRAGNEVVKLLTIIFNLSLSTGIVPENLKTAKVIPIFKKNDSEVFLKLSTTVLLLPCLSKILERLVFERRVTAVPYGEIGISLQYGEF